MDMDEYSEAIFSNLLVNLSRIRTKAPTMMTMPTGLSALRHMVSIRNFGMRSWMANKDLKLTRTAKSRVVEFVEINDLSLIWIRDASIACVQAANSR